MNRNCLSPAVAALLVLSGGFAHGQPPATAAAKPRPPVLAAAPPETVGLSPQRLARMREAMRGFVDQGELAGAVLLVARDGRVAELAVVGQQDREHHLPMRTDTLFRIASQTKAITSVAVLLLYEEGRFLLTDPVSRFLPELKAPRVLVPERDGAAPQLVPAAREITIRDLLTHRSGLTYGFAEKGPVGEAYRKEGVTDGLAFPQVGLAENVARLARAPLVSQPGSEYHYGMSTDVLGRLVEVVSGRPLDVFFRERIFTPLGMTDTSFTVPEAKWPRLAVVYSPADGGGLRPMKDPESFDLTIMSPWEYYRPTKKYLSGGAGLVSTASDYARFLEMLRRGGELGGTRLLSPKTVELMTTSHTHDIASSWPVSAGREFGLGVDVLVDLGAGQTSGSPGAYGWGGIYGSTYWVDPKERLVAVLMTQRYPGDFRWVNVFRSMVYQAMVR
jgi:CubicO group peptidase (beta-lactamase class C family)